MRGTMGDTLKLLLLFCAVTAVSSSVYRSTKKPQTCAEGSYNFKGSCFSCIPCGSFMYEQRPCSQVSNTVCGWCGKKPNLDEISDEVLASYQTKCLMSSLGFIGMTKLKDELINVYDSEPKLQVKVTSGTQNKETRIDDHFQLAKDTLFNFDDSQEQDQEQPDPTLEEGKQFNMDKVDKADLVSGEELTEEEIHPEKKFVSSAELASNEDEMPSNDEDLAQDDSSKEELPMENEISDSVKAFLIKKSEKVKDEPNEWEINPWLKGATIVSLKEVEDKFNNFLPKVPIVRSWKRQFASDEDSNELDIKWDKWVDDKVKPIEEESVEIIKSGEDFIHKIEAKKVPKHIVDLMKKLGHHVGKKADELIEEIKENTEVKKVETLIFGRSIMFYIFWAIVAVAAIIYYFLCQFKPPKKPFTGVPTDAEDYHMIVDASKYVEQLEAKEKKASRHVHVNPGFDV